MTPEDQIREKLSDRWWRLNNLYWIIDKSGQRVQFKPNWAQKYFYNNMWFLCLILKARQLGFTTFIQIFMLDACLFNDNISAGVVAHNREDAQNFFKKKIKYAFDNLPDWLRNERIATSDSAQELAFSNGSSIRVGTSLRSGTYQYLHISEFGKICAKYPEKAEEIVSGAINTVEAGQFIFIESTAEGAFGRFYEMCMEYMDIGQLTKLDYKFFFFPWWRHPDYELEGDVVIPADDETYFRSLGSDGVELNERQKAWYVKKKATQRSKMTQEYPSTPKEAFQRISEHSVYGKEMGAVREDGRIMNLPYAPAKPTHVFFDLGRSKTDSTTMWFMQDNNPWFDFIDYEAGVQKPVAYYAKLMQEKPYVIGTIYLPHDGGHKDFKMRSYEDHLRDLGFKNIEVVPRINHFNEGIQAMRDFLPKCRFDSERCDDGIISLEAYRYQYDEKLGAYREPLHDWASHGESAIRQAATGYKAGGGGWSADTHLPYRRRSRSAQDTKSAWVV